MRARGDLQSDGPRSALEAFDLSGRTAVVTGARGGIGRAIVEGFLRAGADVIGVGRSGWVRKDERALSLLAAQCGRRFEGMACDLAEDDEVRNLGLVLSRRRVDVLVNNAGIVVRSPAVTQRTEEWRRVIQVDLNSQFLLSQLVGRQMIQCDQGKVIFIASILSFQGGSNAVSYAAAKHGVVGLVRALASEWAISGVNVNAIAPGYIETDLNRDVLSDPVRAASLRGRIPAGRWGSPLDVVGAAIFLASAASDYVHGAVLPVDGGWLSR